MTAEVRTVRTREALLATVAAAESGTVTVAGSIADLPSLRLPPGLRLQGDGEAELGFAPGEDGVCVSADNVVQDLRIVAGPARRGVFDD